MGKIIAIANQKGGVGKTTVTLNFGGTLAENGFKVLLIDLDHQANLTQSCGVENVDEIERTIANCFVEFIEGEDFVELPVRNFMKNLDLVPSNVMLSNINLILIQALARETVLKNLLKTVKEEYDYILIDCAPSLSIDLVNALTAADEVLIVSNPAKFSAAGTEQLIKTISKVKQNLNNNINIAGILFNRVDRRTNFSKDIMTSVRKAWEDHLRVFNTEIPLSVRVEESQAMCSTIREYEIENKASKAFVDFTKEYTGEK